MAYKFLEMRAVEFYIGLEGIEYEDFNFTLKKDGTFKLKPPYLWDGATPKINWLGITWGTPDGKLNTVTGKPTYYYASMVHDVLNGSSCPITYKQWNNVAKFLMQRDGHYLWRIYHFVNCTFGRYYGRWRTRKNKR